MLELTQNPEIQERLYQEIKNVDIDNVKDNLAQFKLVDNILKETQRAHSVVGVLQRKCTTPVSVLGYDFRANTNFSVYIRAIHMDPNNYKDPQVFNPDRWDEKQMPNAFLPFGFGQHNCIGQKMANIEVKVF